MLSHDKGFLNVLFMFKESEKNLIHFLSELLYFSLSNNKGFLGFLFNFRESEKKTRLRGGFFFVNLVPRSQKIIKVCRGELF